jgi:hypothetical protein
MTALFASAEEFLASGAANEVDCLLLDIHLGGLSGMAPAAIIAKRFARSGPPGSQAPEPGDNHCRFRRSVGVQKYTNQPNVGDQLVAGGQDACSPFGS